MRGLLAAIAVGPLLVGCARLGGETPRRPPVTAADEVQWVDRSAIVGTWTAGNSILIPRCPSR
jgi:hypothetical protein